MKSFNAMEERFTEIFVLGKPVLFTDIRIERSTVPERLYIYEIRHADEDWGEPVQIAKGILVNFYGTILALEPIILPENGYLDIDPETDWDLAEEDPYTIKEFLDKYE